jgi:hypothetical protein
MKRLIIASLLAAAAPLAVAQSNDAKAPDVPKPNCGAAPELPGNTLMQEDVVRKRFQNDVKKYTECIKAYSAEREAAIKANRDAANQAVNEYNAWQASITEEQKRRRGESGDSGGSSTSGGAGKKGY